MQKSEKTFKSNPNCNEYKQRGTGKFTVLCGGTATCPNSWCGSLCTWVMILVPSGL